jgi:hypothetical protein
MSRALRGTCAPGSNQRGLAGYLNFTASRRVTDGGVKGFPFGSSTACPWVRPPSLTARAEARAFSER